jgi:molybdopterin-containing oxidoreductase family membrane subunit
MAKVILLTGSIVGYAYGMEFFIAWYSGNPYESFAFVNRAFGDYAWAYWIMVSCNVLSPQIFWFKKARTNIPLLFTVSILVNVGMWFERFNIIVTSLSHEFLPHGWGLYSMSWVEWGIMLGAFGWFFLLFLGFVKMLPSVAVAEVKESMPHPVKGGHA